MTKIYLDNAATTAMDAEVIKVITTSMQEVFGNPSSTHQFGRTAKAVVETARKNIAKHFNVTASEIIFTAGGTEADNLILHNAVTNLGVQTIVTSKLEHHAVLHTLNYLQKTYAIDVVFVAVDEFGVIDLHHLAEILATTNTKTLVSLMFVNNEIGNLLPIDKVTGICKKYDALFHSDTVQGIGQYTIDLQKTPIDFIAASAHKFHGPKGVGFAYFKKGFGIQPLLHGGNQEKGARSSTENVHAIVGMEKALNIAMASQEKESAYITEVKKYFINRLKENFPTISFNGLSANLQKSSYKIVSVRFFKDYPMLLFALDLAGIAVSGGSACQSGSNSGSHVLRAFLSDKKMNVTSVRFSFSKHTTRQELDTTILKLKELLN